MKRILLAAGLLLCLAWSLTLSAQRLPAFQEWLDEEHFLLVIFPDRQLVKVNASTGEKSDYTDPADASDLLPEGVGASWYNSSYSESGDKVVLFDKGDLYYASQQEKKYRQLTANPGEEKNPTFSPDESSVAFTRNHNLYVIDLETGLERQLTDDGSDVIYNGYASWVYYEEILGRSSRFRAYYWSPDGKKIAFLRFDDTPVPTFPIYHHEGEDMSHGYLEMTRYPKAGDPLPGVRLGIADIESGEITWVDQDKELDYTAWVYWTPDSDKLIFHQMNRDQNLLRLYAADPKTGKSKQIYEESQPTWVTFFEDIYFLPENRGFLLRSNRDGWFNLYHYDLDGNLVNQITKEDWRVTGISYVDVENERIFFEGSGGNGMESHLFSVGLDGKKLKQLTEGAGFHRADVAPGGRYFVGSFSSYDHAGRIAVYEDSGKELHLLGELTANPNEENGIKVEFFTVPSTDGFDLPAYWVLPPDFDPNKKYPIVFSIYGGPDAGTVYNRFRDYSLSSLVNNGIILFAVDHRASGKFGKKGLDYMHRSLGKWEMHDYIEAVKWLRDKPFIDSTRVGIQGSSYGGYMAAMALTLGADYFTHGIARSAVTDWALYDNIYTERYMDTPKDNPEGYTYGSAMTHADKLKGKLLIIHGDIDDNVHLQNSVQLISKLQDLGKDFDIMFYPGGRHGWGGAKGRHSRDLGDKFWEEHFFGEKKEVGIKP